MAQPKATKKRPTPEPTNPPAKRVKAATKAATAVTKVASLQTNGVRTTKLVSRTKALVKPATTPPKAETKAASKAVAAPKARAVRGKKAVKPVPIINTAPAQILEVLACGEGGNGELGLGPRAMDVKRPRLNALLDATTVGVVQVSAGGMHSVALTHDNKILTWGVSDEGALGRDSTDTSGAGLKDVDAESDSEDDEVLLNPKESTPMAVTEGLPEDVRFVQVAAGDSATFAVTETGDVYGWGAFRVSNSRKIDALLTITGF
jgi:regulator of chromosome condensation